MYTFLLYKMYKFTQDINKIKTNYNKERKNVKSFLKLNLFQVSTLKKIAI